MPSERGYERSRFKTFLTGSGPLPQFEFCGDRDGAQAADFTTELPHQFGQLSRLGGQKWIDKRTFHNDTRQAQSRSHDLQWVTPA